MPVDGQAFLGVALVEDDHGVRIDRVVPGSPAATAGVRAGEYVQAFADQPVGRQEDLHSLIAKCKPGRQVAIGLKSKEGVRSVLVTLGRRPADVETVEVEEAPSEPVVIERAVRPEPLAPRRTAKKPVAGPADLEAELEALRQELRDLRKQLEELRKQSGRE